MCTGPNTFQHLCGLDSGEAPEKAKLKVRFEGFQDKGIRLEVWKAMNKDMEKTCLRDE